ncbi:MAG: CoA transferase [Dehalococcoidia bacterium]|nr:CoA transferase [Dehalococcoidia bacterium]
MQAFTNVRVVEFAQAIAGPFATGLLANLGADVIKVEPPGPGDQARQLMDTGELAAAYMSPLFQGMNAGKRSIVLDLKDPATREVVHRLLARADVVVENARPGAMARLGYGYDAVRAIRPDVVYCSVSGFGQDGPRRDAPAYDGAVQAASGMMTTTGRAGQGPLKIGFPIADVSSALMAAFAIAGALFRRAQTGEGQYLDVSMLETQLWMLSPLVTTFATTGNLPVQLGNGSPTGLPTADVFATADGHIQVSAITQAQVQALWAALDQPEVAADPRFATQPLQVANAAELRERIAAALVTRPAAEWEAHLNAAGVSAAKVQTIPEVLSDAQVTARGALYRFAGREGLPDAYAVRAGFTASVDGPSQPGPAPFRGEQTAAILAELGFTPPS